MFSRIVRASSFSPPPFTPASIANLAGWFQGSDFDATTDGTEVTNWTDHSGLGNNMTNIAGPTDRPTVARNSINTNMTSVRDQGHQGLQSPSYSISNKDIWSFFAVTQFSTGDGNLFALSDGNANGMRIGLVSGVFHMVFPNVGDFHTNESVSYNAWHTLVAEANGANTATVYIDGTALTWASQPSALNALPGFFRFFEANSNFNGYLAEAALYNSAISSGDRANLNAYALSRFGV